jgi:alpha-tubulin suppressor-like RCC1 family protein
VPSLSGVVEIAVGASSACARLGDATLRCWGKNASGEVGDGTKTARATPVKPAIEGVVHLAMGAGHACAIVRGGAVACWGANGSGEASP